MADEINKLQVYKEILNWNKKYESYSGKYRVNPFNINLISSKPSQVDPSQYGNEKYVPTIYRDPTEEAFSSTLIKNTISHSRMTPNQKYTRPVTSSQEIGWFNSPIKTASSSNQYKPKNSCYETYFATEYFKCAGTSPFKNTKNARL